ncbi:DUF1631 family protein [Salicola sp. Rm-C-2C1-2]|uniref:DUF1631 family protein n=1 Tax=Salicola sp. Rm-C-2C1-2 TaxID=3141321 RepID=UPI0032E4EE5C
MSLIESIITELRVPDLPYPVGQPVPAEHPLWYRTLSQAWDAGSDERVVTHLQRVDAVWSMRQVNAAYLADRIMNVFLRRSGLHPYLVHRAARLRFWLALDLEAHGDKAVAEERPLRRWLDSLNALRGWSRTGGRSDRPVETHLASMEQAVGEALEAGDEQPIDSCVGDWLEQVRRQAEQAERVAARLWQTESGAAGQRAAEQAVRAALSRTCRGRRLPNALLTFIDGDWRGLMRRAALVHGVDSEAWRHALRLLEWLIWVGDESLCGQDRNRLYHVGEQLTDKLVQVVAMVEGENPDPERFAAVDTLLARRLRDEAVDQEPADMPEADPRWLDRPDQQQREEASDWIDRWYLYEEDGQQIRQFLTGLLEETGEVLWTNARGAKLGVEPFRSVRARFEAGELMQLPDAYPFAAVLKDTLSSLQRVLESQRKQREQARDKARQEAEALRRAQEEALEEERRRDREREEREVREREEAAQAARDEDEAERVSEAAELWAKVLAEVDRLEAGSWIQLGSGDEAVRLKLALRIRASGKMVFVDRYGLNRREILREELAGRVRSGEAWLLSEGAEFADTLSRVVGRLRVGR